jgi:hypothetical protein
MIRKSVQRFSEKIRTDAQILVISGDAVSARAEELPVR